eukprot:1193724-Prorocentrum_minimum.AAC.3
MCTGYKLWTTQCNRTRVTRLVAKPTPKLVPSAATSAEQPHRLQQKNGPPPHWYKDGVGLHLEKVGAISPGLLETLHVLLAVAVVAGHAQKVGQDLVLLHAARQPNT